MVSSEVIFKQEAVAAHVARFAGSLSDWKSTVEILPPPHVSGTLATASVIILYILAFLHWPSQHPTICDVGRAGRRHGTDK